MAVRFGTTAYERVGIQGRNRDADIAFHTLSGFRPRADDGDHAACVVNCADEPVTHLPACGVKMVAVRRCFCLTRDPDGYVIDFDELR